MVIKEFTEKQFDCIIGLANVYTLAPIARVAPYWNIPVLTTIGRVPEFDDKQRYRTLTRISGTYSGMSDMFVQLMTDLEFFGHISVLFVNEDMFTNEVVPQSECYFLMNAIKREYRNRQFETNNARYGIDKVFSKPISDYRPGDSDWQPLLKNASAHANGLCNTSVHTRQHD